MELKAAERSWPGWIHHTHLSAAKNDQQVNQYHLSTLPPKGKIENRTKNSFLKRKITSSLKASRSLSSTSYSSPAFKFTKPKHGTKKFSYILVVLQIFGRLNCFQTLRSSEFWNYYTMQTSPINEEPINIKYENILTLVIDQHMVAVITTVIPHTGLHVILFWMTDQWFWFSC